MTARCGSIDPAHRSRKCRACDRIYKQRAQDGVPPARFRLKANAARCIACGLSAGNSLEVPVYRYNLKRWKGDKARWIGSVGLCDRCLTDYGELKPEYRMVGSKAA